MASITALFNQKHSLNITCVFCFHFIRSRPTVPPMKLKLLTEWALGPGEAAAARAITVYSTCILSLNAAIQNSESNHHSDKTLLQE